LQHDIKLFYLSFESLTICYVAGPCGGKTTGQSRLSTFFENLGWKVGQYLILELHITIEPFMEAVLS